LKSDRNTLLFSFGVSSKFRLLDQMANQADARWELQDYRTKADQVTNQSLESTQRMRQLCETTQLTGTKTLEMLGVQGEKINGIETGMDKIGADLKEAEKSLSKMEKWWWTGKMMPWHKESGVSPGPEIKKHNTTGKQNEDKKVINTQQRWVSDTNGVGSQGGHIAKITDDAREDEMEENLRGVSSVLGNLRNMALDMGTGITDQNIVLDRLNDKSLSNQEGISGAHEKVGKLLKS